MLEVGQGVPLEIPGPVVLCRGWCGLGGTDQVDALPQVSPYPSHPSRSCPTETFPVSYHAACPFSCTPAFTRFSLHLDYVFHLAKILLSLQGPPWRSPLLGSLPGLNSSCPSYCTPCTMVSFSYRCSLGNLVCLQNHQWSFESTDFEAGYPESAGL